MMLLAARSRLLARRRFERRPDWKLDQSQRSKLMTPALPAPKPSPPPAVFVDPGLILGGVMVNGAIKKAYLFQKTDKSGAWVGDGDDFIGWRVQSITADAIKLQ
jgi:hypothetical protein